MSEPALGPISSASQGVTLKLPPELASNPQYEIVRELGRGGMGVVYLAKNKLMDRFEVLKVVNKTLLDQPGAVERFLREIRSAAKLNHANVVAAYSAVQQGDLLAFAMEYVEGQDLSSLVKTQGPLPVPHACLYVQQAALGLQHAFEKGMVHRDIKPQNLILAREGKRHIVKVLDFGLAKATREKKEDTGLTGEGQMLGTPDYVAPEQTLDAAKADIRADIYSLGCTLYYLLSGHAPFRGASLGAILLAHQMQEAKPLNLVRPEVPEELSAVVSRMMAKSPAQRFQTPGEVVKVLAPFGKLVAPPKSSPEVSAGATGVNPAIQETRIDRPPASAAETTKMQTKPEDLWATVTAGGTGSVATKKNEVVPESSPSGARPAAKRKWILDAGIGVGVLLLAVLGMFAGGVFKVKTKNGTIVLLNLPAEAEVTVDGEQLNLDLGDGKPVEIRVAAQKKHLLQVKKDGFKVFGQEVEMQDGDSKAIRVTLERETAAIEPPPEKPVEVDKPPEPKSEVHSGAASKMVASLSPGPKTANNPPPVSMGKAPRENSPPAAAKAAGTPQPAANRPPKESVFVPLFNGKDLTGWKTHPKQPGNWKVVNGILVGSGPMSHLYSERSDYENFHFRAEAMISDGGNSGMYFRAQFGLGLARGYEAQIDSTGRDSNKTGSLYGIVNVAEQLHKPDEWFTQEVITRGDHIVIKVNDKKVVDTHDSHYKRGHFALQQHDSLSVVKFRKVEVKELPSGPSIARSTDGLPPEAKEAAHAYEKACAEARTKFLAEFDSVLERLPKVKGTANARLKLIEAVKEEKNRFEDQGLIPWSEPMRSHLARYLTSTAAAEEKLRRAYNSVVIAQPKGKKEKMLSDLQADMANLIGVKVVARWRHFVNGNPMGVNSLLSNGRVNNPGGNSTWSFINGALVYRWPTAGAPGGVWIDTLNVSVDGTTYAGTNNAAPAKRPNLTGTYVND
jgi:serine/threonine protein kinase